MKTIFLMFSMLFVSSMTFSQSLDTLQMTKETTRNLRGVVVIKETGRIPIRNAMIVVQGTLLRAFTNNEGEFMIPDVKGGVMLSITAKNYIGVRTFIPADVDLMMISLRLDPALTSSFSSGGLGDLSMAMLSATGNVVKLDPERTYTPETIINKLRMLPGVEVGSSGVRIRGAASFQLSTDPLLVVDGVVMGSCGSKDEIVDMLSSLDPDNIATIVVLKGSEGAIYGSRGASGVIVITTRAYLLSKTIR